jgi:hypothetical protein
VGTASTRTLSFTTSGASSRLELDLILDVIRKTANAVQSRVKKKSELLWLQPWRRLMQTDAIAATLTPE